MGGIARPAGGRRRRIRYPAPGTAGVHWPGVEVHPPHLARHGARIAAAPERFLVQGLTGALTGALAGALAGGELERARAWGQRLTRSDCLRGAAGRRQAS